MAQLQDDPKSAAPPRQHSGSVSAAVLLLGDYLWGMKEEGAVQSYLFSDSATYEAKVNWSPNIIKIFPFCSASQKKVKTGENKALE